MVRTAFSVIDSVAVMVELATEVAVTVAVVEVETVAGAVYTTEVVVLPLSEPGPERVQVTPPLVLSLATTAVIVTVAPGFSDCPEEGDRVTVMELLPPEQPAETIAQTRIPNANNERTLNFVTISPLKVVTISLRNSKPLEREQRL